LKFQISTGIVDDLAHKLKNLVGALQEQHDKREIPASKDREPTDIRHLTLLYSAGNLQLRLHGVVN
jgi:hypothetical protein